MHNKIDALNEVKQDTLAKITLAAAAGIAAAIGGKKLYKKYKEKKLLNKYVTQGEQERQDAIDTEEIIKDEMRTRGLPSLQSLERTRQLNMDGDI